MDANRYRELIQPNIDLMLSKHEDYGSAGAIAPVPLEEYFPFAHKSYVQMLHVKTQRLVSLTRDPRPPNHEKIEDTVRDLINYAVFYLDYIVPKDE
jgi:hypothetical protein